MRKWLFMLPIILSSCGFQSNGLFPGPLLARDFPPPGPPNYQQGMIDGCKTALSAVGSSLYAAWHHGFHQDWEKAQSDEVYYKAWKDGYFYCKYDHDKAPE